MDLSVAFDTVDHEILLLVLEKKYYITGNVLKWISTYLQPRNFKVYMDDKYSNPKDLWFSVPQGTCNGPMYFNLYCGTISECIPQDLGLYTFADDHEIDKEFEPNMWSQNSAYSELQKTLLNIHN